MKETEKKFGNVSVVIDKNGDVHFWIDRALCYDEDYERVMDVALGDDVQELIGCLVEAWKWAKSGTLVEKLGRL